MRKEKGGRRSLLKKKGWQISNRKNKQIILKLFI